MKFVVTGHPVTVPMLAAIPLHEGVTIALRLVGEVNFTGDVWIVKDQSGNILDQNKTRGQLGFHDKATVFVNRPAGVAA